jgi:ABC-type iron transport system FetAB permease component
LTVGDDRRKALLGAVKTGCALPPCFDQLGAAMGLVSLPGIMTGQILAGAAPADA